MNWYLRYQISPKVTPDILNFFLFALQHDGKALSIANLESNLYDFNFCIYSDASLVPLYTKTSAGVVMTKNVSGIFMDGESEIWITIWFDSQQINTVMICCISCLADGC